MGIFKDKKKMPTTKDDGRKYSFIPEVDEEYYEKLLKHKEFEKASEIAREIIEDIDERNNDEKVMFVESLKVDQTGTTQIFKREKIDKKELYKVVMDFMKEKNLSLNDGVRVKLEGKNRAVIKYTDENGKTIIETISISSQHKNQEVK